MVRFFYKEKEHINAKILKVHISTLFLTFTHGLILCTISYTLNLPLTPLPLVKDVKFPMSLDVHDLCSAELREKQMPMRNRFKSFDDKSALSKSKVFSTDCLLFIDLYLCLLTFKVIPNYIIIVYLCSLFVFISNRSLGFILLLSSVVYQ